MRFTKTRCPIQGRKTQTVMKEFTILGERCSGTNFLQYLLLENFDIQVTWRTGWKHFFGHEENVRLIQENPDVLFLGIVRNPIDFLMSFYSHKHHQPPARTSDLRTFLTSEFYSMEINRDGQLGPVEIMEDRNFATGDKRRFKNIFEMRSFKNRFLFEFMPQLARHYQFIRYEDLKSDPRAFLANLGSRFSLKRTRERYYIERNYVVHGMGVDKGLSIRESYDMDEDTAGIVRDNLDLEIENAMAYFPKLPRRQLGEQDAVRPVQDSDLPGSCQLVD